MEYELLRKEITSPALQAVAEHWAQARGNNPMPRWGDLRPSQIARQLNIVWAYKFDPATRQFTGRLAGNRITEGFGKNFRGARLEDLHPPASLPLIYEHMLRVVETPAVYKSSGTLFRKGAVRGVGERIILPLGNGAVDGVIGVSDYELAPDTGKDDSIELQGNDILWFPVLE
ncbi:MAG: hypothetical protein BGN85_08455 [Alphaproteobacteria bacterium 64-11]|nr:PAS domain-containing protein [Alphaproteobacteria bacterium]OJU10643.1 MAG: hypothetical protein BGN85_08455 [Alphaproteobacteria bacterium 64-11]